MIYVVAGNADQAYEYINRKIAERVSNGENISRINEYKYVDSVNAIRGIRNPTGVFIGTWKKRKDIFDIVSVLRSAQDVPNKALRKVWQELMIEDATPFPLLVNINGVTQSPNTDYIQDKSSVVFTNAPPAGSEVTIHNSQDVISYQANGSLTRFKIPMPTKLTPMQGGWINQSLATDHAAGLLAQAIDEEVLAQVLKNINGGRNG